MRMQYDYLVVGAGLFGCVFAQQMIERGKSCLVIDKREHIGGNTFCLECEGIRVHQYGPHIFHTSNHEVWQYVNRFVSFNRFVNAPVVLQGGQVYNLPINMNTFAKLWGIQTPAQAQAIIAEQTAQYAMETPITLEQQALKLVGHDIYRKLIKGYTQKQWGRSCSELPAFIIRRLPLRYTFDNNYFDDLYQGIPVEGYNEMAQRMLAGADVLLSTDYFDFIKEHPDIAPKTVFTGMIDAFFDYRLGHLEYRTVTFENEVIACENWQGNAVVNYADEDVPYTRVIEHKHFEFGKQPVTVISREYPCEWRPGMEPYYPIRDEKNMRLYQQYEMLSQTMPDVIFGGRLGCYRYDDMDKVIGAALQTAQEELRRTGT